MRIPAPTLPRQSRAVVVVVALLVQFAVLHFLYSQRTKESAGCDKYGCAHRHGYFRTGVRKGATGHDFPRAKQCDSSNLRHSVDVRLKYIQEHGVARGTIQSETAYAVQLISAIQHGMLMCGDVGEIGTQEGTLPSSLLLSTTPTERLLLLISPNPPSTSANLLTILNFYTTDTQKEIHIIHQSSMDIEVQTIHHAIGPFRLLSLDGEKRVDVVMNDLEIAGRSLVLGGVVVVGGW
ncbi:hypothetical protein HK097_003952 [Rhizophlyctis rosea]|uniref:Uncharacterized protein n=1 Tax=Rhizophlyctis rosea TaxID=64517 RepID=A0AAD5X631_9FUNG|nr:hypothetical protein HK097_003952 [Rhizophlyctis rosea]